MAKQKNILAPEDIQFKFLMSMGFTDYHHSKSRCEEFGIQMEQITKKKPDGEFGRAKNYYFIDDCEREFNDLQTLCDVWNELKDYDDPNNEIVWEKKIVKKINLNPTT